MISLPCFARPVAIFAALSAAWCSGQVISWNNPATGAGAGEWGVAANWTPAGVPTSANSAQISNGGEALVTSSIAASRIEVGKNNGVGRLTSAAPGIELIIDSDFDIGEIGSDFASGAVSVTGDGVVSISNAAHLLIGESGAGDLDLGQTNATAGATSHGTGVLSLDAVALVEIVDDADVGQAGGSSVATANGTFQVASVGMLSIGADLDIAQSGGSGQASATGVAAVVASDVVVGVNVEVGRVAGSAAGNSANGSLELTDSTLSVGFADPLDLGSLSIGDAGAAQGNLANAVGLVTVTRSSLEVGNRISVGGLLGGGLNQSNTADGTFQLLDSSVAVDKLNIAVVTSNTQGAATGRVAIDSSLIEVDGALTAGAGAAIEFGLAGTTKADGSGAAGQYGAILADSALLDGTIAIELLGGFVPVAGDFFDLVATTNPITGTFSPVSLPELGPELQWRFAQTDDLLRLVVAPAGIDADFQADGDVDGDDFLTWQRNAGMPSGASLSHGDADGDGDVDQDDLAGWASYYGVFPPTGSAIVTIVPEPGTAAWALFLPLAAGCRFCRRRMQRLRLGGRSLEL